MTINVLIKDIDMKRLFVTIYALLHCLSLLWAQNPEPKALAWTPTTVVAGGDCEFVYHPELSPLKGESDIQGVAYFWKNFHWEAVDLELARRGDSLVGSVRIPEDAAVLLYKFTAGEKKDIGAPSLYASFIFGKDGNRMPSANIGWALLRGESTQKDGGIPGFLTDEVKRINDDVVLYWINNEIRNFPEERKNVFRYAFQARNHRSPIESREWMLAEFSYLEQLDEKQPLPEETWLKALEIAQNILKNDSLAQIVKERILKRYPDGILTRDGEIWRIFRISDSDEKEKEVVTFLKRFPPEKFVDIETETAGLWYGKTFQSVIYNQVIKHNNYQLLLDYLPCVPYAQLATFYWHIVQIPYRDKQVAPEFIIPYSTAIINEKMNRKRTKSQLYYSPREWKENIYNEWKEALLVHAKLKNDCGDSKGAIALLDTLVPYYKMKSAEFNSFYVEMLGRNGRDAEVIAYIKAGLKENAASPEMLELLKRDYAAANGSGEGFDTYLNTLKFSDGFTAQKQKVLSELINEPIRLFEVEALDGTKVNMSKMKGKILVLDFWATWCAPCKAAMPGMQMAVNKYKDDKDVSFLFVSTMETDKNYKEKIAALLKEKGYNFQVVLDAPDPNTKKRELLYNTYSKAFKFSGIPQKMIIDGKGRLRWRSTGYGGSPSALADEISFVVDYLKNENSYRTDKYKEEEVVFHNADSLHFGATLTLPLKDGKVPVAILVSGTGKQDRDGTIAGHKMFADIADYLGERGIAMLRMDDRGVGDTNGVYETATTADFATDVLTAVNYLKSRKDLKLGKIGLIGHSEGGAAISIAASRSEDIAFMISLSGLATDALTSLIQQNNDLIAATDIPVYNKKRYLDVTTLMLRTAYRYADSDSLEQKLNNVYHSWKEDDEARFKDLHAGEQDHFRFPFYMYVHQAVGPWYRFFIRYNPQEYLSKVKVPVLALNGDKDIMVAYEQNLNNFKKYLTANKDVTTMVLPGLNHLFLPCEKGTQDEYAKIQANFSEEALEIIYSWIKERFL
jgi:pimeloyl-ACP methyl ester carboxylesterase